MAEKDETMPVSSDQNTNPKMSMSTNNHERRYSEDSIHKGFEHITEKYIPKPEPKTGDNQIKKTEE